MIEDQKENNYQQEAWVVFSGETDLPWLKILKQGYRHCFVLLNDGQRWMSIDPLASFMEVQIYHHLEPAFDLPAWLHERGYSVLKTSIERDHQKPAPVMFFSCVESIKRLLGIHKRFILTPWQLYRFLKNNAAQPNHQDLNIFQKEISNGYFNKAA